MKTSFDIQHVFNWCEFNPIVFYPSEILHGHRALLTGPGIRSIIKKYIYILRKTNKYVFSKALLQSDISVPYANCACFKRQFLTKRT